MQTIRKTISCGIALKEKKLNLRPTTLKPNAFIFYKYCYIIHKN